jgi:hypothetical protein
VKCKVIRMLCTPLRCVCGVAIIATPTSGATSEHTAAPTTLHRPPLVLPPPTVPRHPTAAPTADPTAAPSAAPSAALSAALLRPQIWPTSGRRGPPCPQWPKHAGSGSGSLTGRETSLESLPSFSKNDPEASVLPHFSHLRHALCQSFSHARTSSAVMQRRQAVEDCDVSLSAAHSATVTVQYCTVSNSVDERGCCVCRWSLTDSH